MEAGRNQRWPPEGWRSRIAMEVKVAATSSWSELPAALIGQVLLRLPSLADRVRLRAVCRPWRDGAQRQALPPPLLWLALRDGGLVDLHGAPVRSAPIRRQCVSEYLAVDNLAFLVHKRGGGCSLVNPLSGTPATPLPQLADGVLRAMKDSKFYTPENTQMPYVKVILSSPLDSSPDPLIAALILEGNYVAVSACKRHDLNGFFGLVSDWTRDKAHKARFDWMRLADIAFLHGRLYALTMKEGLYVFGPNSGCLNVSSGFHQCITNDPKQQQIYRMTDHQYMVPRYLAECHGRLFMLRRWMRLPLNVRLGDVDKTFQFEVFEADVTTTPCQWRNVDSLGGNAIFLGSVCTKFVHASKCAGGVQEDCIYFMHRTFDNPSREYIGPCVDPLGDSGVYNMRNGEITPLLSEEVMAKLRLKRQFLTWFFPTDV